MKKQEIEILIPQYVKDFKCIGGACEDTCCAGWRVDIDEESYKKYKRVSDYDIKKKLEKNITRNRSNPNKHKAAKMKLQNNRCSFLTEEALCELQMKLGTSYLCDICMSYPRIGAMIEGRLEKTLTLSCPEAARKALLNEAPMEFDICAENRELNRGLTINNKYESSEAVGWKKYFWSIREFSIDLMQNRQIKLEDRLIILGTLFDKLDKLIEGKEEYLIPELIEQYNNNINNDIYKNAFDNIPQLQDLQIKLCAEIVELRVKKGVISLRYNECLKEMIEGLELKGNIEDQVKIDKYQKYYNEYYIPFLKEYGYILENYLVNYIFMKMMPLDKQMPFESYMQMLIHYMIIKLHLIGMSGQNKGITKESAVKLIQSICKVFGHNSAYFDELLQILKKNNYDTLAYMVILIKN